jgi:hypothetical protein
MRKMSGTGRRLLLYVSLGILLLATLMASAIAWRVSGRTGDPGFPAVFAWQLAVWLPWVGYWLVARRLVRRTGTIAPDSAGSILLYVAAALVIAASHLVWYWFISSYFSPLLGMRDTRFGVYPFFFIFWFLIDLVLFGAAVLASTGARLPAQDAFAASYTRQFTVRKGRAQHIVRTADINWIEAQGYYAGLHTNAGTFLIRKSLSALEGELDPASFVRVHRSTIVNIEQVNEMRNEPGGALTVSLLPGEQRKVSREGRRRLKEMLDSRS